MNTSGFDNKKKIRLDLALVERGLFISRQEAQTAIMDGAVLVNKIKCTKSGTSVSGNDSIELRPGFVKQKYVSRGGLKLEKAIQDFQIDVKDRICLDVGASTGGFTDCLLKSGAALVYAIDVGYGQLDWSLRTNPKVVVKERVNARYLSRAELYGEESSGPGQEQGQDSEVQQQQQQQQQLQASKIADLAVIDCSFISLEKILPAVKDLLDADHSEIICLIKPQFEAGKDAVKKGVVRNQKVHAEVLNRIADFVFNLKLELTACTYSPLKGPKGNIEYLMLLTRRSNVEPEVQRVLSATDLERIATDAVIKMNADGVANSDDEDNNA
ncbi:MAG: TlyA family RNA methyltransferase [Candidatus Melainabacteria bacterium]|nr:TlyA family RNA methyltransferase [Candidatus Melainabacteria bacterium]